MGKEAECTVCNAYIPIEPDARAGDEIYCSYCGTRLMIKLEHLEEEVDDWGRPIKVKVEEDWD